MMAVNYHNLQREKSLQENQVGIRKSVITVCLTSVTPFFSCLQHTFSPYHLHPSDASQNP